MGMKASRKWLWLSVALVPFAAAGEEAESEVVPLESRPDLEAEEWFVPTSAVMTVRMADPDPRAAVDPADAPAEVWSSRCAMCHGADGRAQTAIGRKANAKDVSQRGWQESNDDDAIRRVIRMGVPETKMRAYDDKMSEQQLDGLVRFIRSLAAHRDARATR